MPRIAQEVVDHVKREVKLSELCRDYGIELKPHGADLIGLCPFHDDHEPSFVVTPAKNLWNCLGACGAGGDNIQLVMKKESVSFRHAVEILQRKLGLAPAATFRTRLGKEHPILATPGPELTDAKLLGLVADFYHQAFQNHPNPMKYLQGRKVFDVEAVKTFRLGYANRTLGYRVPDTTTTGKMLKAQLQKLGILRASGHEHFNGCVIFPIRSEPDGQAGEILGMYGRRLHAAPALRSEALKHLYLPGAHRGVWNAAALRGQREWLLTEAALDALSFWVNGFRQVTWSYGVHGFSPDHLALLQALRPERVLLAYDPDEAGNKGSHEVAQLIEPLGIRAWRVPLPNGQDVNDLIRASDEPRAALSAALAQAYRLFGSIEVTTTAARAETTAAGGSALAPLAARITGVAEASGAPDAAASTVQLVQASTPSFKIVHDGKQAEFACGERTWRVRGLEHNTSFDQLKVNVRVQHRERFHLDTFDLYNARARVSFIAAAEQVTGADKAALETDLAALVNHLEQHQEQQIFAKLKVEDTTPAMSHEEEAEALKILKSPKLLEVVLQDLHRCGLVGEETNLAVAWLVSLSRKLDKPLGVCVMSRSAAGKSSLLEAVAQFVPEEDRHQYTALTPQALFHMPENELAHKALFVAEDVGAEGASYSLKTIQSDGQLVMACTMKDETTGQMMTKTKIVRGPVAVFLTSTSRSIDDELLNRLLVLTIDEGEEQTRRIHAAQRHAQTLQGILERRARPRLTSLHQNIQRLIRPLTVRNPLTEQLRFQYGRLRSRRDHQKYLDLINVMALAHQYQRDIKSATDLDGQPFQYIEVSADDVRRVDGLLAEVLPHTTDELWPASRRMLAELQAMAQAKPHDESRHCRWTRRQVRERTGWSDTQVRLVLGQLVDFEFVWQFGGGQGRRAFYQLADEPAKLNGQATHDYDKSLRNLAVTSQSNHCEVGAAASSSVAAARAAEVPTSQTLPGGDKRTGACAAS